MATSQNKTYFRRVKPISRRARNKDGSPHFPSNKISSQNSLIEHITYNFQPVKLTRVILFAKWWLSFRCMGSRGLWDGINSENLYRASWRINHALFIGNNFTAPALDFYFWTRFFTFSPTAYLQLSVVLFILIYIHWALNICTNE